MQRNDFICHTQTEADAARTAAVASIQAVEGLKNIVQFVMRNAEAQIRKAENGFVGNGLCPDNDLAPFGRVAAGIFEQLRKNLDEFLAVAEHFDISLAVNADVVLRFTVSGALKRFLQQFSNNKIPVIDP